MPDVTELLMKDHREVEDLFERYGSSQDPSVAERICTELTVHTELEEEAVYPALAREVPGGEGMRSHSVGEHDEVSNLIFQVAEVGAADERAGELMRRMEQAVTEHVREEEDDVFPKMREAMGQERLNALGEEAAAARQELAARAKTEGLLLGLSKEQLYELAQKRDVAGRSDMGKAELIEALRRH